MSSTSGFSGGYNQPPHAYGYENVNNPSFESTMSSFFGSGQQYHHFYDNTDDDEMIQPARHSFWQ